MRTEEQVLKDFEKLGYKETYCDDEYYEIEKKISKNSKYIAIDTKFKTFGCYVRVGEKELPYSLELEEHKLLHELFELWGWFDERYQ